MASKEARAALELIRILTKMWVVNVKATVAVGQATAKALRKLGMIDEIDELQEKIRIAQSDLEQYKKEVRLSWEHLDE